MHMGRRRHGHGGHVTNLPILKRENCTSLKAGHDNRVRYAFLHRYQLQVHMNNICRRTRHLVQHTPIIVICCLAKMLPPLL